MVHRTRKRKPHPKPMGKTSRWGRGGKTIRRQRKTKSTNRKGRHGKSKSLGRKKVKGGFLLPVPMQQIVMSYPEKHRVDDEDRYLADKIYVTSPDMFVDNDFGENWKNDSMAVEDWLHALVSTSAPYLNVLTEKNKNMMATQEDYINEFIIPHEVKRINYIPDGFIDRLQKRANNRDIEERAYQEEVVKVDTNTPVKVAIVEYIINQELHELDDLLRRLIKATNYENKVTLIVSSIPVLKNIYDILVKGIALENFHVTKNVVEQAVEQEDIKEMKALYEEIRTKDLKNKKQLGEVYTLFKEFYDFLQDRKHENEDFDTSEYTPTLYNHDLDDDNNDNSDEDDAHENEVT